MAKDSAIEWTHHTFNPWWGCVKVSPGCKHCYAETWAKRLGRLLWGPRAPRRQLSDAYWRQPFAWNEEARKGRTRNRVFCASMADVFEGRRDLDHLRARLWPIIEATTHLDWLLLTKRPENVAQLAPWKDEWPDNVWLGTTAENQRWADKRLPILARIPARVRFVSCEPLLGPLSLQRWVDGARRGEHFPIDWVIAGGESGFHARPMNPEWTESLRDECEAGGVAFHFKQWGNWFPVESDRLGGHKSKVLFQSSGDRIVVVNVGKKAAGRKLAGRTWDQFPASTAA